MRANARVGANALGDGEGLLEQAVERIAQAARVARRLPGFLDLAEDLRLAEDHRIQPGGHAEQMPNGAAVDMLIQVAGQRVGLESVVSGQPVRDRGFPALGNLGVDFGPIAGRQQGRFLDALERRQRGQRRRQRDGIHRHLLAQGERGGLVVEAEGDQGHGLGQRWVKLSRRKARVGIQRLF